MLKVAAFLLALCSVASAHTALTHVTPAPGSVVSAPKAVSITLSEPINLRFSTFKVYALPASLGAANYATKMLPLKGCDTLRADTCPALSGTAAHVTLPLRPLSPGPYVLMWHVLSDDGHPVSGQSTFSVK